MNKRNPFLSVLVQKINDRMVVLQAGAKIEILKELMEDCWKKMDEVENNYQNLRAFKMPLLSEDIRENCNISASSQCTTQSMQSAQSLLYFFKNMHMNDAPIAVRTQPNKIDTVPDNPLTTKVLKLSQMNPAVLSGRLLRSKNIPTKYDDPQILRIRFNTLQRLIRLRNECVVFDQKYIDKKVLARIAGSLALCLKKSNKEKIKPTLTDVVKMASLHKT